MWNFQDGLIAQARAEVEAEYLPLLQAQEEQLKAQEEQLKAQDEQIKALGKMIRGFAQKYTVQQLSELFGMPVDQVTTMLDGCGAVAAAP